MIAAIFDARRRKRKVKNETPARRASLFMAEDLSHVSHENAGSAGEEAGHCSLFRLPKKDHRRRKPQPPILERSDPKPAD
jgi:hypothetical protein